MLSEVALQNVSAAHLWACPLLSVPHKQIALFAAVAVVSEHAGTSKQRDVASLLKEIELRQYEFAAQYGILAVFTGESSEQ
jgi:hypothetical protein